jgi:uncharacterized hydrophobic protein (TIGR00341 family)
MTVFVPDAEAVLEKLISSIDLRYRENIIEVSSPDFVISSSLKRMERESIGNQKTPVEELILSTKQYSSLDFSKVAPTSIAGLIALTGLFMNNSAIVIGAMLLSPLLGPIYSFAINIAVGKPKNAIKSTGILAILLFSVFLLSSVSMFMAGNFSEILLTNEISSRAEITLIYIPMAILLGFASVLALTKGIPEGLAGVAIAAALLPPVVVAGILLVVSPPKAIIPAIITLQNVMGMMAGSLIAVIVLDVGPRKYYERAIARKYIKRGLFVLLLLLILITALSLIFP